MKKAAPDTLTLPNPEYQPSKAELEEPQPVSVPGDTVREQMNNFADAVMREVNIEYADPD